MFEHKREKLISNNKFRNRLLKIFLIDLGLLIFSLLVGVIGYHVLDDLSWVDSFVNASMILGGMGPVDVLKNDASKICAGVYALFSGITFLTAFALLLAPIYHRFLHKFHLEETNK